MELPPSIRESIVGLKWDGIRDELVKLMDSGADRAAVYDALGALRAELRIANNEPAEDLCMEVMDLFHGWCAPGLRL